VKIAIKSQNFEFIVSLLFCLHRGGVEDSGALKVDMDQFWQRQIF
jgi:hypothetical protein